MRERGARCYILNTAPTNPNPNPKVFPLLSPHLRSSLRRLHHAHRLNRYRGGWSLAVIHHDPGRYVNFLAAHRRLRGFDPVYVVGRSTFETDRVPDAWRKELPLVDEVWVPSEQGRRAFMRSTKQGSPLSRFHVVPPPLYLPEPGEAPRYKPGQRYRFLSVFKWEPRKNPEGLLEAYWREFSRSEPVTLVLRTRPNPGPEPPP